MASQKHLALLAFISSLALPLSASAAQPPISRLHHTRGTVPPVVASTVLTNYAANVFGVTVTTSNSATGLYGGRTLCQAQRNPAAAFLSSACHRAGRAVVVGTAATASGSGPELVAGSAALNTEAISSTGTVSGTALSRSDTFGYLQLSSVATYPTSATDAQSLALTTFPQVAGATFTVQSSPNGTYLFVAQNATVRTYGQSSATVMLAVFKSSAGQTEVAAAVGTGSYSAI